LGKSEGLYHTFSENERCDPVSLTSIRQALCVL
jgi:hypothetical protein